MVLNEPKKNTWQGTGKFRVLSSPARWARARKCTYPKSATQGQEGQGLAQVKAAEADAKTELVNAIDRDLVLRDKLGGNHGQIRGCRRHVS